MSALPDIALKPANTSENEFLIDLVDCPLVGKGIYDPDLVPVEQPPELFLPIGAGFQNGNFEVYGLAVSPSPSCDGAFKRVGFFVFRVENGVGHGKTTITQFSTI
jgi:hypothetical protein